jgi:hypothetical protein
MKKEKKELWKPIEGYEGLYEVSNFGRVRSFHGNKRIIDKDGGVLSQSVMGGYYKVVLHLNKHRKMCNVHRLVAIAFIKNERGLKEVNHKDENKLNNRVDNLEWVSHRENILYSDNIAKAQNVEKKKIEVHNINGGFIGLYESEHEAARRLNCDQRHISKCCNGIERTHKKLVFKFQN